MPSQDQNVEWRPVAVLTQEVAQSHAGATWAFRKPGHLPELHYVVVDGLYPEGRVGVVCLGCDPEEPGPHPPHTTECRPVDSEGVPIAWSTLRTEGADGQES